MPLFCWWLRTLSTSVKCLNSATWLAYTVECVWTWQCITCCQILEVRAIAVLQILSLPKEWTLKCFVRNHTTSVTYPMCLSTFYLLDHFTRCHRPSPSMFACWKLEVPKTWLGQGHIWFWTWFLHHSTYRAMYILASLIHRLISSSTRKSLGTGLYTSIVLIIHAFMVKIITLCWFNM